MGEPTKLVVLGKVIEIMIRGIIVCILFNLLLYFFIKDGLVQKTKEVGNLLLQGLIQLSTKHPKNVCNLC